MSNASEFKGPDFRYVDVPRLLNLLGLEATQKRNQWQCKCPGGTHFDKHPSWSIRAEYGSTKNGKHHCFSCGYGGTCIDLVQTVLGFSPIGAAEYIQEKAMREPHPFLEIRLEIKQNEVLPDCSLPEGVSFASFEEWPQPARDYIAGRKITPEQVSKWGLGYATSGKLSGRIVIPTYSKEGKLLSYTARTYTGNEVRYLSASRADNPRRDAIFGEQYWDVTEDSILAVTEGAFNAMAVERAVPELFVGALSGSHLEPGHLLKMSKFTHVVILTDPDHAGDKAARAIEQSMGRHSHVERLRLPEGTDCDSISKEELREWVLASLR